MAPFPPTSRKRRREPVNVDVKLVELYEDLANENGEIRLKAAQQLVSRFTPDQKPSDDQIEKTLQRLFRGLCSGRKAARIGFSIALTETLSQVFSSHRDTTSSNLGVARAIEIWEAQSTPGGAVSGQEERDHHFGRLFGAEALIKSSVLFQSRVPFEEWVKILTTLFALAKKKPWLREECGWIIFCSLRDIQTHGFDVKYAKTALDVLCQNGLAKTPEGVSIWIAAIDLFSTMKFPEGVWKHGSPLHVRERATLAKIMKETSESQSEHGKENDKAQNSGVWNPKLHFAWDIVLQKLYTRPSNQNGSSRTQDLNATQASFTDIWTDVVDTASSEERKYWGFLLFIKTMNEAPPHLAALVFTKNLMRCFMNQLAVEDRYLHRIAARALRSIQARIAREPEFIVDAISGLMGPNGAVNFDHITKTKTIEKMISTLSVDTLKEIIPLFEKMIAAPGIEDVKAAASTRQQLAGYLLSAVRTQASSVINATASDELQSSIESVLLLLARFAYFVHNESNRSSKLTPVKPPITEATQELFRNRMMSCLHIVISGRKTPAAVPYTVVRKIHEMDVEGTWGKFVIEMGEDIKESVTSAFKTLKKLTHKEKRAEQKEASSIQALILLYSMTILQVYNGDADAVSMLDELKFCYSTFLGHKSERDEAEEGSDALVEILLSFASKQSQLFRRMSEQVFGAFADQVTATGLQSLIDILDAKDTLAGQEEIFESQEVGSDVEMVDAENTDDDEVDDVEVISQASSGETSDKSDEESEGSDSEEEDDGELESFEAKLASALGTHRADKDLDASSSGSEDASMDDDEMEALDDQIAKVFRARKQVHSKKKEQRDAKETMLNFKNRVLDLLEIYVKKCHSSILALNLLMPLLQLSRKSRAKQIATRAGNVLREYTKQCKGTASIPAIESAEPVWELLKAVHQEATHSGPAIHASACSQASLLLVKILVAHGKDSLSDIVDIYGETRKKQLTSKKCHVQPSFFSDWNNWCVSASKQSKE
ncbi:DNA polymerase V [Histoplasma capsulatum var. duboisii H88]|uniref:DNA polymerase V n=2 Tax=Ajellomyces capsulatus TaxID=5037 RepID=F0UUD8_AJEC8|nr:DNA polymerase V [Histoplasma capsulatum H143]EGC49515.1 DNA polymerase V [Histoplasma capsulatum var. duboisii H88]